MPKLTKARTRSRGHSDFKRESICEASGSRVSLLRLDSGPGQPRLTAHRRDLPPWDRTFDAVYHEYAHGHVAPLTQCEHRFKAALEQFFTDFGRGREKPELGFARLPDKVRLQICQYLLLPLQSGQPLRLNKASFNRDSWNHEYFQSPEQAFQTLQPYLEVSFGFRADVLVTFLLDVPLHVTFSPYVGPRVSPLATTWMNTYGIYARNIVVEVDLSRLGCGPSTDAAGLLPGVDHIEGLLLKFVEVQLQRDASQPLDSLVLLCRRFYGQRYASPSIKSTTGQSSEESCYSQLSQRSEPPSAYIMRPQSPALQRAMSASPVRQWLLETHEIIDTGGHDDEDDYDYDFTIQEAEDYFSDPILMDYASSDKTPSSPYCLIHRADYCPDSYLVIFNHFLRLRGHVDSLRMCGFSESYTNGFIASLFPSCEQASLHRHAYRVTPSTIWPRLSGQKAYVDFGDGVLKMDDHDDPPLSQAEEDTDVQAWEGCVQLPPPVLDSDGNASLPSVVGALERMRIPDSVKSEETQIQVDEDQAETAGLQRRGTIKLFDLYGKGKGKAKRTFSREPGNTL